MNNIHEKEWAEESWSGHTGMNSLHDHSIADDKSDAGLRDTHEDATYHFDITVQK